MQAITISGVILLTASAAAQGPQFDVGAPPGAAGGASTVGQPLGQANFPDFETPSITPFSGKVGVGGVSRPDRRPYGPRSACLPGEGCARGRREPSADANHAIR